MNAIVRKVIVNYEKCSYFNDLIILKLSLLGLIFFPCWILPALKCRRFLRYSILFVPFFDNLTHLYISCSIEYCFLCDFINNILLITRDDMPRMFAANRGISGRGELVVRVERGARRTV